MKGIKQRKLLVLLAAVAGLGLWARPAEAANFTITVAPSVSMNVQVTTDTVQWNMAGVVNNMTAFSLAGGATDYMVRPATVTVTTAFADTELELNGAVGGGWTLSGNGDNTVLNNVAVTTLLSATSAAGAPVQGDYVNGTGVTGDQLTTGGRRYGRAGSDDATNASQFQSVFGPASENLQNNDSRHLWVKIVAPTLTSDTTNKTITVNINAVSQN